MSYESTLSIVGAFITFGLTVNGFFLKGIFDDLNDVKLKLAEMIAETVHNKKELDKLEAELNDEVLRLRDRQQEQEARINSLEHKIDRILKD
jgi:peptidoglycan hydrolase CwlO-like protein